MKLFTEQLKAVEPYYFYAFVLLNLIPVLSFNFFPTVDGPAHLYNSNLILDLIKEPNSIINNYLEFNKNINSNWSGHFLMTLLLSAFPAFVAEKIILLIYLIGLPLSFRYLLKTLTIENKFIIYLIFPFTYSFLFYYGFYNFNIGLVLFFYCVAYWVKNKEELKPINATVLAILSTLICLSHLFVFALFLLVLFILNIDYLIQLQKDKKFKRTIVLKNILFQVLAFSVGIFFMLFFLLNSNGSNEPSTYISYNELLLSLKQIMPAKGTNYGKADIFIKWLFYIFSLLIISLVIFKIVSLKKNLKNKIKNFSWLIITLVTLLLLFIIPDIRAGYGFISSRLMMFFFIFLIVWLASQKYISSVKIIVFVIINYINFSMIIHNYKSISTESSLANSIYKSSELIKPYSVVLPILNSSDFLHAHISNYLGADKPLVILENYEASLYYFPLKWKLNDHYDLLTKNSINNNCNELNNIKTIFPKIDYVFILDGENKILDKTCSDKIDEVLNSNFHLLFKGENNTIRLYKKRKVK